MRLLLHALVCVTALSSLESGASAAVPTVAVLPFRDLSGGKASVGEAIRETVTSDTPASMSRRAISRLWPTTVWP